MAEQHRDPLGRWIAHRQHRPPRPAVDIGAAAGRTPAGRRLQGAGAKANLPALQAAVAERIGAQYPGALRAAGAGKSMRASDPSMSRREIADRLVADGFTEPEAVLAAGPLG